MLVPKFTLVLSGGEKIRSLPMTPTQARAFLKMRTDRSGNINRNLDVEVIVQVGPIPFGDAVMKGIPARIIAARLLDPVDGKVLRTYDPSLFQSQMAETTTGTKAAPLVGADDAVPMADYLLTLMALRGNPQLARRRLDS